ncbi:MAG: hypothetical protein ACPGYV_03865 [Phycisphaeraceae bacterium]
MLLDKFNASRRAPLYFSRPPDRKNYYGIKNLPDLVVREGKWKLLCDYDGSRPMLFNLENDPGETRNIAEENPQVVQRLTGLLVAWYKEVTRDQP